MAAETSPLYFADLMMLVGVGQCYFCPDEWKPDEELLWMELDTPENWQRVCYECRESMVFEA